MNYDEEGGTNFCQLEDYRSRGGVIFCPSEGCPNLSLKDVMERSKKISRKVNEEKNELVTLPDESKRKGSEGRGLRAVKGISSDKL